MIKKLASNYLAIVGLFLAACAPVFADSITLDLSAKINGSTLNAVPTATFSNLTGSDAGKVLLTLTVTRDIGNSHDYSAIDWLFNFGKVLDQSNALSFVPLSGDVASVAASSNAYQAGALDANVSPLDAYFDIKLSWSLLQFVQGETSEYVISYTGGPISIGDFEFTSSGLDATQYYSALYWHGSEGWLGATTYTESVDPSLDPTATPEPSTIFLLGGGLMAVALALRRRRV